MAKFKKAKKAPKYNNPYKIPSDEATEIRSLGNKEIIERASLEYNSWTAAEREKKGDPSISSLREKLTEFKKDVNSHPDVVELQEQLDAKKNELIDEQQATIEEEIKNANQPLIENVNRFRGAFRVAMDEISDRHKKGILK